MKIIEIVGTTKSGKTKIIELLSQSFGESKNVVVSEVSFRTCPFKNLTDAEFDQQAWTIFSMISKILEEENKVEKCDLLILDRGLWDRKILLEYFNKKDVISKRGYDLLNSVLDEFLPKIDLVFCIVTPPEISKMRHEVKGRLPRLTLTETEKLNRIMLKNMPSNAIKLDGLEKVDTLFTKISAIIARSLAM